MGDLKDMRIRATTVIIGMPLLLISCYIGGWLLAVIFAILAVLAAYELDGLFIRRSFTVSFALDAPAALLLTCTFGLIPSKVWPFAIAVSLTVLVYAFWSKYREEPLRQTLLRALATIYVGVGFGALLALRLGYDDWRWILLALLNVWITDSAAHLVGSLYGRNMLAPRISPRKTWEGALAGLLCGTVLCSIYMSLFLQMHFFSALPLAMLFSVAAQAGDLGESAFKRWAGVKDSGQIFPGHGGVLDRFDSLFLSAPLILLLLCLR
jgi:phosphatidate cytidylyltransferase